MDLRCCVRLCIAASIVFFAETFNIEVNTAPVKTGMPNSGFGFSAEFIEDKTATRLLVTAPHQNVTDPDLSGRYYLCSPLDNEPSCGIREASRESGPVTTDNGFGEKDELFGLTMTLADKYTAVICGPLWKDYIWWNRKHSFTIGRCRLLNLRDELREGVRPYFNYRKYTADISLDGGSAFRQMFYGMAEFGVSSSGDGNGRVVIGAPGFSVARGGVVVMDTGNSANFTIMETILDPSPDTLLGYAVAIGNFCGPKRTCFAVSNRLVYGKVYLIEFKPGAGNAFPSLWKTEGTQTFSSFGSALCAMDVNGDGWADLLVGAPTFTVSANDSRIYDAGRVFVYISNGEVINGKDNFRVGNTLTGDDVSFSRFGFTIGDIGDINRDSYNDIAVGAPMADEGHGVVYIYLGGPKGPNDRYSQKIQGRQFRVPLMSFGAHISKPTSAHSDYGYPDFAVGAPDSDAVVFLRSRLIVNAEVSIQAEPNPLDPKNDRCPPSMDTAVTRASGCLSIHLCMKLQGIEGAATVPFERLQFDVDLDVDTLVAKDGSRRVRLYNDSDDSTTTKLTTKFQLRFNKFKCKDYVAILKQDQINRNPFSPVQLHANFSMVTTSFTDIAPILNQSMPNSSTKQVQFKNKCGADGKCRTDLVLSGHVVHEPSSDYGVNVVNKTSRVELVLGLLNRGETSFGVRVTTNITGSIDFRTATGDTRVSCNAIVDSVLTCESLAPLGDNETTQIHLQFLADTVPLETRSRRLTFDVKVMPQADDPNVNPELKPEDNSKTLHSKTAIIADLGLVGWPDPRVLHVQDSDVGSVRAAHRLLLTNRGPSFLPPTHLNVSLPYSDKTGAALLDRANVTIRLGKQLELDCPLILLSGVFVQRNTPSPDTSVTDSSPTTKAGGEGGGGGGGGGDGTKTTPSTSGGSSSTDDPFGEVEESKRRRRRKREVEDDGDGGDGGQQKDAAAKDDKQLKMTCADYGCRVYSCKVPVLQPNQKAEVNVEVVLLRSALSFPGNIDTMFYTTTTTVAHPEHPLFYDWDQARFQEVKTTVKRVSSAKKINIWFIVAGILGGLALLLIIACVAYHCGCFKRKKKDELERMKRASGFYNVSNNRASTKSRGSTKSKGTRGSKREAGTAAEREKM